MLTIAVDFDGVIHTYEKGYHDGTIYGGVIPGTIEALTALMQRGAEIVIHTARDLHDLNNVRGWLLANDVPFTRIHEGRGKPIATIYIDDRALRFEGCWVTTMSKVNEILSRPWPN